MVRTENAAGLRKNLVSARRATGTGLTDTKPSSFGFPEVVDEVLYHDVHEDGLELGTADAEVLEVRELTLATEGLLQGETVNGKSRRATHTQDNDFFVLGLESPHITEKVSLASLDLPLRWSLVPWWMAPNGIC
jgi:hypothetical protein